MACAKICDRCGDLYLPYNIGVEADVTNGIATISLDEYGQYYVGQRRDLCPNCNNSLTKWLCDSTKNKKIE